MNAFRLLVAALVCAAGPHALGQAAPRACAVPGETIQWMADYCMLTLETDDEIAASGCIEAQQKLRFRDACAAKLHFKRAMCGILARSGTVGSVARCVADPAFRGRTVERGGVGN